MSKIQRFEDLIAWQKARELTKEIYVITRQGDFAKDYGLSGQMQRAAVSIMSNVAEGFEHGCIDRYASCIYSKADRCAKLVTLF